MGGEVVILIIHFNKFLQTDQIKQNLFIVADIFMVYKFKNQGHFHVYVSFF